MQGELNPLVIASGGSPGVTHVNVRGYNRDIDSTAETIWLGGGILTHPTAARTHDVVSTDANDTSAGTGCRTLLLTGLDSNWEIASETITMNGTTNVPTTRTYLRIFTLEGKTYGSGGTNAGAITATAQTDATVSCYITADFGMSFNAAYTVPANKTGYITRWYYGLARQTSTTPVLAEVRIFLRKDADLSTSGWNLHDHIGIQVGGNIRDDDEPSPYIVIPEKTDIRMDGVFTSTTNTAFTGGFDIILVDN